MVLLPVDTSGLFAPLRESLVELLNGLDEEEWMRPTACEGWSVADVVAHMLGVELGNVSRRRDGHRIDPPPGAELGQWVNAFNEEWVRGARRLSPRVLVALVDVAGRWLDDYVHGVDLESITATVSWVGPRPVPVWLDVAREYSERWVHQQQIRDATSRPGLTSPQMVGPVISTFVHALPRSLDSVDAPINTSVDLRIVGDGGGTWHAVRAEQGWDLATGASPSPACELTGTVETAWRLYANYPGVTLHARGDGQLAVAVMRGRAIIV
jgi:uncharacterized protein (TIGR03083 family)